MGHAGPHVGLDLEPVDVAIHHGPDLVKLVMEREEFEQRAVVGIFVQRGGPFVVEVVGNACCGTNSRHCRRRRAERYQTRLTLQE